MRHFLFECIEGDYEGEQFLVAEDIFAVAKTIAENEFGEVRFLDELTEFEAEMSGLDEW